MKSKKTLFLLLLLLLLLLILLILLILLLRLLLLIILILLILLILLLPSELSPSRRCQAAAPTDAQREKWRAIAAKKGFFLGQRVEAALHSSKLPSADEGRFEGSWYVGSVMDVEARGVRVRYERKVDLPDLASTSGSGGGSYGSYGSVADGTDDEDLEGVVPYDALRPAAPDT